MRTFIVGFVVGVVACVGAAYFLFVNGSIDVGADSAPSKMESNFAMKAVDAWADRHAGDHANPFSATDENLVAGATVYLNHCAGCHGVPSNPESRFQHSFYPPVPAFFNETSEMGDSETFYVIKRGIRWTGMPAWSGTLSDNQIWQSVLFLDNTQKLSPAARNVFEPNAQAPSK